MGIDTDSFDKHKECSVGDVVSAKDTEGNIYEGTVVEVEGATVYVQSQSGKMLEFRRLKDGSQRVIALGIDGKEIKNEGKIHDEAKDITKESYTLSFDYEIVLFESESTTHEF